MSDNIIGTPGRTRVARDSLITRGRAFKLALCVFGAIPFLTTAALPTAHAWVASGCSPGSAIR